MAISGHAIKSILISCQKMTHIEFIIERYVLTELITFFLLEIRLIQDWTNIFITFRGLSLFEDRKAVPIINQHIAHSKTILPQMDFSVTQNELKLVKIITVVTQLRHQYLLESWWPTPFSCWNRWRTSRSKTNQNETPKVLFMSIFVALKNNLVKRKKKLLKWQDILHLSKLYQTNLYIDLKWQDNFAFWKLLIKNPIKIFNYSFI